MPGANFSITKVANGNITPFSGCKYDTSDNNGRVILAGAGERALGISQGGVRRPPGIFLGMDDGYVAVAGEHFTLYVAGARDVPIRLGGTVTAGQRVKLDGSGFGVSSTTDKDQYIGVAKVGGASGEIGILEELIFGEVSV